MNLTPPQKPKQAESWPRKVTFGRESVTVYKRKTPSGNPAFMVANYSGQKRRFDAYSTETDALEAANRLARQLSQRDVLSASMTREQTIEFASAIQTLQPLGITLSAAVATIVEAVKLTGDLSAVAAAARFYKAKHKPVTPKAVADVVIELLALKKTRGASARYLDDLKFRLEKFAAAFPCPIGSVTTATVQTWLDGHKLSSQTYSNNRRVAHLLCGFAVSRGYALENPVTTVDKVKIRNGEIEIFTPDETRKLMLAATENFRPCLAIGLFAGLRSAEIERLEWEAIDLKQNHIIVGADTAKTASRRIVPISENLSAWLLTCNGRKGPLWTHGRDWFHKCQLATAKNAGVSWKRNGARHSFVSYSFALCADAGRVAGYCGNSASMIHRHYRQLATPADATEYFAVKPAQLVTALPVAVTANQLLEPAPVN